MKRLLLTLTLLVVFATSAVAKHNPQWLKDAVIYHIYPSTYMDSDGNGIGSCLRQADQDRTEGLP